MAIQNNHRGKPRLLTTKDLVFLCKKLNDSGVKYVLIGGFAVNYYGFSRVTVDIDILVDTSEENISKIKKALKYLPEKAAEQIAPGDVEKYKVVRVSDEIVIDLMARACEVTYKNANIKYFDYEGVSIPIVTLPTLIKTKQYSVRPKDKEDIRYLKEIKKQSKAMEKEL
ncbi:nucleotidyl transferase AbiEii/AbiGii toxin family protein [bacterium]|nr:nucleotidyl transferase AbiEii/AbiGii toxin family protein [bacterium]